MNETMTFAAGDVLPDREAVFEIQGIPPGASVSEEIEALYAGALTLFPGHAAPVGLLAEISKPDFETVYHGEGRNEPSTPVGDIFGLADSLALFAVTLGEKIGQAIGEHFKSNDYAMGYMLDSVASAAADKMVKLAEDRYLGLLTKDGCAMNAVAILAYSPGYCGWHLSGQKKLFECLRPERIGITLRDSFLMEPLKSVSGVMIAGPSEIHRYEMSYTCCARCKTHSCRERT